MDVFFLQKVDISTNESIEEEDVKEILLRFASESCRLNIT